ncbi:hypothetical protein, partial [Parvibaculum sp.]|uniref:hypothetical protein n=1 Tax=Parvibaculum sp. TaxID=2024848 RepID=UPI003296C264
MAAKLHLTLKIEGQRARESWGHGLVAVTMQLVATGVRFGFRPKLVDIDRIAPVAAAHLVLGDEI